MGANTFMTEAQGKNAQEAFNNAVEQARYDYGHAGYTGSIAEKNSFVVIPLPAGEDAHVHANRLIEEGDPRVDDKWGDAGCIALGEGDYLFFGWASS